MVADSNPVSTTQERAVQGQILRAKVHHEGLRTQQRVGRRRLPLTVLSPGLSEVQRDSSRRAASFGSRNRLKSPAATVGQGA